jgi:hypothetical protein
VFLHKRAAEESQGLPLSGLAVIHVGQALEVQFRRAER